MFRDKLKKILNTEEEEQEGNDKKKIENLVFFVVILIITIIGINIIWNGNSKINNNQNNTDSKQLASKDNTIQSLDSVDLEKDDSLEDKLQKILSKIQGVGDVDVCINYSETSEVIAMYNETSKVSNTEETDTSGGVRKIEENDLQKDIIYKEDNGEKVPITQKVIKPKIEGAIITARGAKDVNIKTNIIQAVEAATGLATHKIQVFEMN